MKLLPFVTLSIALILQLGHSKALLQDVVEIIEIAHEIGKFVYETADIGFEFYGENSLQRNSSTQNEPNFPFGKKREKKILRYIKDVSQKLYEMSDNMEKSNSQVLKNLLHNFPAQLKLELRLNEVAELIASINIAYKQMLDYTNTTTIERLTLEDFAIWCVSHDSTAVKSVLERIQLFIAPTEGGIFNRDLLELVTKTVSSQLPSSEIMK